MRAIHAVIWASALTAVAGWLLAGRQGAGAAPGGRMGSVAVFAASGPAVWFGAALALAWGWRPAAILLAGSALLAAGLPAPAQSAPLPLTARLPLAWVHVLAVATFARLAIDLLALPQSSLTAVLLPLAAFLPLAGLARGALWRKAAAAGAALVLLVAAGHPALRLPFPGGDGMRVVMATALVGAMALLAVARTRERYTTPLAGLRGAWTLFGGGLLGAALWSTQAMVTAPIVANTAPDQPAAFPLLAACSAPLLLAVFSRHRAAAGSSRRSALAAGVMALLVLFAAGTWPQLAGTPGASWWAMREAMPDALMHGMARMFEGLGIMHPLAAGLAFALLLNAVLAGLEHGAAALSEQAPWPGAKRTDGSHSPRMGAVATGTALALAIAPVLELWSALGISAMLAAAVLFLGPAGAVRLHPWRGGVLLLLAGGLWACAAAASGAEWLDAIRHPRVSITTSAGETVTGVRVAEDGATLRLRDAHGLREVPLADVAGFRAARPWFRMGVSSVNTLMSLAVLAAACSILRKRPAPVMNEEGDGAPCTAS